MSDKAIERWKQRGLASAWWHARRYVHWNLSANVAACEALLELLELFERSPWPARRRLDLVKPQRTATRFPENRATFANELLLKFSKTDMPEEFWGLDVTGGTLRVCFGSLGLRQLRGALLDMKEGDGDYWIGCEEAPLWVWWHCS